MANPKADPRKMRRIIAEDPEWNLETVSPLSELCLKNVVCNFHERPLLAELLPKHRQKVLDDLPTTVPLQVTAPLIEEEKYWEKCCRAQWSLCIIADYGGSWKRMFFEKYIKQEIEKFVPQQDDEKQLEALLKLSSDFVQCLELEQLLPPVIQQPLQATDEEEEEGNVDVEDLKPVRNHLSMSLVLQHLKGLKELHLTYGVKNCGMNFAWDMFEFTQADCQSLAAAVKASPQLQLLHLHRSKLTDDGARLIISKLLDHPSLQVLDFSHNQLEDRAGRALGKLLNGRCSLQVLDVSNNNISTVGATSIGHALQNNTTLKKLNLRLNRLGDEGAQHILKALMKNKTLEELNIGSNDIGEPSCATMSELLIANSTLTSLIITCNRIGEAGGKMLQEGVEENKTLTVLDLRLTDVDAESEYCMNQIVKNNCDRIKSS